MHQELQKITEQIEERRLDRDSLVASLKFLRYNEREFRRCAASNGNKLASLKQELDKLSFANNAYQDRSIISYPSEQKINVHNLNFLMRHGRASSSIEEKQLLKEINEKNRRGTGSSCLPMEELNANIRFLSHRTHHYHGRKLHEIQEIQREMTKIQWSWEKAFANVPVKGKTWNTLPSKQAIKDQIKVVENESDKLRKEHLEIRAKTKLVGTKLKAVEKDITFLRKRVQKTKHELQPSICKH